MRKNALVLLLSGGLAVCFAALLLGLSLLHALSTKEVYGCLTGISLAILVSFYALAKLAKSGHLMTDMEKLLKMK